ncbi:ABC transporter ATP-binding protein [Mycoplasmopsis felifaucium]|uniref:ABC transporter ATP-binding protein n=1 Tax=Mycoplasmopsis felifaucium TaxID=35768 RepID=A0ABZ2RRM3_9BACT|nr:ABC transporter ATP-binding protein [Mycoplasmopsis felifaucium]
MNSTYILEVKNLSKSFGKKKALDNLSFKVGKGELYGFLGVNGAGKTTTLSMIVGLLHQDTGTISIDGNEIKTAKDFEVVRNKIGVVFQESILDDNLSVKDNLLIRATLYHKFFKNIKPIELVNEIVNDFDLTDILNQKYRTLSGGQRRRVDIARALIHKPEILFLDEPTTGLDPNNRKLVWDTLKKIRAERKLTIILTTHYMEEANSCDYAIIIDKGVKLTEGTPAELKSRFSNTTIFVYGDKTAELEKVLLEHDLNFSYDDNAYAIVFKQYNEATDFLEKYKDLLKDFELKKGTMDDVFLNVTKKEAKNV